MITEWLNADNPSHIERAAQILRNGGLVGLPTETVYGLAANALDGKACARIFEAKNRPVDNPLIVHISDFSQWDGLVTEIPEKARRLAEAYWPGPLTIILPKAPCIPNEVSPGLETVSVRFPAHPAAQAVIKAAGIPLAAPSANLSGRPSTTCAEHVWQDLNGKIDAVLDGGECEVGLESTVISLADNPPKLLRPGGVTLEELEEVLGPVCVDPAVTAPLEEGKKAASPGMKYKHYAPKIPVKLVEGSREAYISFVNSQKGEAAALCYNEDVAELLVPCISYGEEKESQKQAHELFDALRRLDTLEAKVVYARLPDSGGVGLAVYNRLIRAAGFEVIRIE